jgi:hypothetical protein
MFSQYAFFSGTDIFKFIFFFFFFFSPGRFSLFAQRERRAPARFHQRNNNNKKEPEVEKTKKQSVNATGS